MKEKEGLKGNKQFMPKICLLITTFNRSKQLNNTLQRLCNLTLPDEVLVVDDGSADDTRQVVENFKDKLPIRYIYNNNPEWSICSFARNIGVKNTDCDIIITSEPELLWITDIIPQMMEDREKYPNEIISAGVIYHQQSAFPLHPGFLTDPETALKDEIVEEYQTQPRGYRTDGYVRTFNMQATFVCLYEKKWLLELGGWDEEMKGAWGWDDVQLATRLRINGINQHICPEMKAVHQWHPHLPPHLQGAAAKLNEDYMKSQKLDTVEQEILEQKRLEKYKAIDPRLIANKGREWGVIKP